MGEPVTIVQTNLRMPKELKIRLDSLKYELSAKRNIRVTNDEIIITALKAYLKKFGK
jgi:predicted DNA-binding protein